MGTRDHSRLNRLRRFAAWVLWAEALTLALAPGGAVLLAYAALGLLGLGNGWLLVAVLIVSAGLLLWGLWRFKRPAAAEIDRRIEAASHLPHRPFAALNDMPENDVDAANDIWAAHQRRAAAALASARSPAFNVQAVARDKFALRGLLLAGLLAGLVVAGPQAPLRIAAAFTLPDWPFPGPHVTAWVTPPRYTGAPPHVLAKGEAVSTLVGSQLTVITDGPTRAPKVKIGKNNVITSTLSDTSHRADATITGSAVLTVGPWWHRLAHWDITAVLPAAPVVQVIEASIARGNALKLRWHVADHYGLNALTASFKPVGYPQALTYNFELPARTGDGQVLVDLSKSPFDGEPVTLTLTARNVADVTASDRPAQSFTLPGLRLHDATAVALVNLRRDIADDPASIGSAAEPLQHLSQQPPSAIDPAADVQIAALGAAIWLRNTNVPDVVARLLALALEIEAGPDFLPAQQFAASNQALMAALQAGLHGTPPNVVTLQKLLKAMQAAAARHIGAIQAAAGQTGTPMNLSALDQLADKIVQDEAAGRTDQAAQELKTFQRILSALQNARPMSATEMAQSKAANAAMQAIADMIKAEAALLDATNAGTATADAQDKIQNQLNATRQSLTKRGVNVPSLGPAGTAMQTARSALGQGDLNNASTAEATAIKNLQTAAAALAKAASQELSLNPGADGEDDGNGTPNEQSDPHFNPDRANPAAAIQQQIIQQDAKPAPTPTHQYYHKLLESAP
ncbi:MAG: hypothetical protein B7Z80_25050 [Rhodospirillales bacterium 20-64-7]|nr:MAG: hypothetical protein B7Z80_25050 [Rhodospirillales bacterium 20-64-7]